MYGNISSVSSITCRKNIQTRTNSSLINSMQRNESLSKKQSRYNVIESPVYCSQSDAYKVLHPDVLLEDMYVWRDYGLTNLQKRITTERAFSVFPFMKTFKKAGLKYEHKFPVELSYIFTSVSSLYNNYHWGRGLGCNFQKYNHMPGKSSIAQKNQLIDNFINSIKKLKDGNADPECVKNATFIPQTYRMQDKEACVEFFEFLNGEEHERRYQEHGPQFILKTNAHRGEGIRVLFRDEIEEIKKEYQNGALCGRNRKNEIAQRYISNPFLYKGHKIEFRIYCIITSTKPMVMYSYKRALIKRCAKPFSVHSTEKAAHVCNTAIVEKSKRADDDNDGDEAIEDEEFFIDWYLEGLQELLLQQGRIQNTRWLDEYLYPRIHRSLIHMVRSTYHTFSRDSRFGEFFAVDFLLDDDLEVWVLEVNYNPQVLAVTPDRIKRNFKMVEDTFEIQFKYIRSKYLRLVRYLRKWIYPHVQKDRTTELVWEHKDVLLNLVQDRLEPEMQISPDNLYVKIMDESLSQVQAYNNLIQDKCFV